MKIQLCEYGCDQEAQYQLKNGKWCCSPKYNSCPKCKSKKSLHCHHIEGIRWEPLESADIDKCITLCKKCHKQVHEIEGCKYQELRCGGVSLP